MNAHVMSLVGRLLLALVFVPAGFSKIGGFEGTVGYIASVGLPLAAVGAVMAILVELVGGLMLAVGFKTRVATLVLALFTIVAAVFFHNYWAMPAEQQMMQQIMFFKNIGLAGGLLAFAAFGAGALSMDAKRGA